MTKPRMFFVKKILFAFLAAGVLVVSAAGKPSAPLEPTPHMSTIARATAFLLTNHHFSQQKMDEKLSEQLFQDYFKALDPAHIFFTQQDLAAFDGVKNDLGNQIRQGNIQFAFDVFKLFLTRLDDYEKFTMDYLKTKPSLDSDDTYEFNRTKLPWVKNRQQLESLWKKKIRNDLILLEMLDRFDEKGYAYYAAGRDREEAAKPLVIEHNGNRFAFVGCNIAGPDHVYVDDLHPGVNPCDLDVFEQQIRDLTEEGYLVIATLQYYEIYSRTPSEIQERDFKRLSDAGAVIISGSQAHYPQTMVPKEDRFIHYGLGNLFFDQMDVPVKGTRQEFLDRYVFYDGRLLNVQLITALLEEYSRPRLMTDAERADFLREVFEKCEK